MALVSTEATRQVFAVLAERARIRKGYQTNPREVQQPVYATQQPSDGEPVYVNRR